jgi:hypothetical protein
MEADRGEFVGFIESGRAGGSEREEVAEVELLRCGHVLDGGIRIVVAPNVDVVRRARRHVEPKVEREGTLEHPPGRGDLDDPSQE